MRALLILSLITLISTAILACEHDGKTYKDGDEWNEKDVFVMQCKESENGWKTEVVACVSPSGAKIPLGDSLEEGNHEWKCTVKSDGMISLQQGISANAKCDTHDVGDKWQEQSFEFECERGGRQKLVGCVTDKGEQIPVGESKEIDGFDLKCEQFVNGTVSLHGARKVGAGGDTDVVVECVDSQGGTHPVGSTWIESERFNKTCTETGQTEVKNCVTQDGLQIPLDGDVVRDKIKFICEKTKDGAIRFASGPADKM